MSLSYMWHHILQPNYMLNNLSLLHLLHRKIYIPTLLLFYWHLDSKIQMWFHLKILPVLFQMASNQENNDMKYFDPLQSKYKFLVYMLVIDKMGHIPF